MNKKITLFLICTFFAQCAWGKELDDRQEIILKDLLAKKHLKSEHIDEYGCEQEKMVRKDLLLMRAKAGEKALQCLQSIKENQNAAQYKNAYWTEYYNALENIFYFNWSIHYTDTLDNIFYFNSFIHYAIDVDKDMDHARYPEFPMFLNPARCARNSVHHLVDELFDKYATTKLVRNMHAHWDN